MANMEAFKEAADVLTKIQKLNEFGFYGWNVPKDSVQMRHKELLGAFPEAKIERRNGEQYPYSASVEAFGVRFFSLMSQEEFDELARDES